jgi:hypothetical protein
VNPHELPKKRSGGWISYLRGMARHLWVVFLGMKGTDFDFLDAYLVGKLLEEE